MFSSPLVGPWSHPLLHGFRTWFLCPLRWVVDTFWLETIVLLDVVTGPGWLRGGGFCMAPIEHVIFVATGIFLLLSGEHLSLSRGETIFVSDLVFLCLVSSPFGFPFCRCCSFLVGTFSLLSSLVLVSVWLSVLALWFVGFCASFSCPGLFSSCSLSYLGYLFVPLIIRYGRFPKCHRVFWGRDPGTLKSDIVSNKYPQSVCSDLRFSN